MVYSNALQIVAHWAAILTAAVAAAAYGGYVLDRWHKQKRLEEYLREQKQAGKDRGQRTVLHLIARLGMTETQILDAAFRSRHVQRVIGTDSQGRADVLFLEYANGAR